MKVVTRFAPSPTGFLHIGGARTALFNWLYSRANEGEFLLRIEDTDKKRSTKEAIEAINISMEWLGLNNCRTTYYQSENEERHADIANQLLAEGKAYHCYCSKEELEQMRENAKAEGRRMGYDRTWRDKDPSEAPAGVKPVIRIKAPISGESVIADNLQGSVKVNNEELDDFIILRADGTPTYMLAVVVDDHDMGVTHIIRGDDHLNNAFRQKVIYDAMGWDMPSQTHIPLIHGSDGAKLSKRHGALGVEAYKDMGFLPEAICNYLLRLGWSHGDDEIITTKQAIEWFNLDNLGKSPSRFDIKKLENINAHYIKEADNQYLLDLIKDDLEKENSISLDEQKNNRILSLMDEFKKRAKTLIDIKDACKFLLVNSDKLQSIIEITDKASKILDKDSTIIPVIYKEIESCSDWNRDSLESLVKGFAESNDMKMGQVAGVLRVCLVNSHISPSVFDIMISLGKEESLARINNHI